MAQKILTGIPVATGIAIGKAFFVNRNHKAHLPRQTVSASQVPLEIDRLHEAFTEVESELSVIREQVPTELRDYGLLIDNRELGQQVFRSLRSLAAYIKEHTGRDG